MHALGGNELNWKANIIVACHPVSIPIRLAEEVPVHRLLPISDDTLRPTLRRVWRNSWTHQRLENQGPGGVYVYFAITIHGEQVLETGVLLCTHIERLAHAANEPKLSQRGKGTVFAFIGLLQALIVVCLPAELSRGLIVFIKPVSDGHNHTLCFLFFHLKGSIGKQASQNLLVDFPHLPIFIHQIVNGKFPHLVLYPSLQGPDFGQIHR